MQHLFAVIELSIHSCSLAAASLLPSQGTIFGQTGARTEVETRDKVPNAQDLDSGDWEVIHSELCTFQS